MQRSTAILLAVAAICAACTSTPSDPEPTPTATGPATPATEPQQVSGRRVAVVVHPGLPQQADLEQRLTSLPDRVLGDRHVRVAVADEASFVLDMARFFTTEGYDLVCVLGPTAGDVVRRIAPSAPATRFCAAPVSTTDLPANVLPVDVRVEELGHLAGMALGTDLDAGPVTIVPSADTPVARIRSGLRQGLRAAGIRPPAVSALASASDADVIADRVARALATGTRGVLSLAGPLDPTVRDVVLETPVTEPSPTPTASPTGPTATPSPSPSPPTLASLVTGSTLTVGEGTPDQVLVVLEVHLDQAVRAALARTVDAWDPSPVSVGVAEGAITATVNPAARTTRVGRVVEEALSDLREDEASVDG